VNDAGQGYFGLFAAQDIHRLVSIINLNISSLTVLTQLFLHDMVARNEGKVLQLASVTGELPGSLSCHKSVCTSFNGGACKRIERL